jgi:hypothetical protein
LCYSGLSVLPLSSGHKMATTISATYTARVARTEKSIAENGLMITKSPNRSKRATARCATTFSND